MWGAPTRERDGAPDDVLIGRIVAGSEAALASLYDRYADGVFRTALRVNRDRTVAEEVVQETFLALWDRAEQFDGARGTLHAWLATIARHRAIDRHRAAGRRLDARPFSSVVPERPDGEAVAEWLVETAEPVAAAVPEALPDVAVATRETVAEMARALADLAEPERETILLAYRDGLSQSEIAARLGWPLGTVKTRSRRALRRLREALAASEAAPATAGLEVEEPARLETEGVTRLGVEASDRLEAGTAHPRERPRRRSLRIGEPLAGCC